MKINVKISQGISLFVNIGRRFKQISFALFHEWWEKFDLIFWYRTIHTSIAIHRISLVCMCFFLSQCVNVYVILVWCWIFRFRFTLLSLSLLTFSLHLPLPHQLSPFTSACMLAWMYTSFKSIVYIFISYIVCMLARVLYTRTQSNSSSLLLLLVLVLVLLFVFHCSFVARFNADWTTVHASYINSVLFCVWTLMHIKYTRCHNFAHLFIRIVSFFFFHFIWKKKTQEKINTANKWLIWFFC